MCYGSGCRFELPFSGECGHRPRIDGPAPCSFESEEEYEEFIKNWKDDRAEYLYEQHQNYY